MPTAPRGSSTCARMPPRSTIISPSGARASCASTSCAGARPRRFPGSCPAPRAQKDKRGAEIDQGLFLSAVLADPVAGAHLCHAMLLPTPAAQARLELFREKGDIDLRGARVHREGRAAIVTMRNPRFL